MGTMPHWITAGAVLRSIYRLSRKPGARPVIEKTVSDLVDGDSVPEAGLNNKWLTQKAHDHMKAWITEYETKVAEAGDILRWGLVKAGRLAVKRNEVRPIAPYWLCPKGFPDNRFEVAVLPTHEQISMLVLTPMPAIMGGKPCDYDEPIYLVNTESSLHCAVLEGAGQSGVYTWHLRIHREKDYEKTTLDP